MSEYELEKQLDEAIAKDKADQDCLLYCPFCGSRRSCQFTNIWEASTRVLSGRVIHTQQEERICEDCNQRFWIEA